MSPETILQLLHVRALEESDTQGCKLSWQERERATREALKLAGEPGDSSHSGDVLTGQQWNFLSHRAALLCQDSESSIRHVFKQNHLGRWGMGLCAVAFIIGWTSHGLGLSRSFDLLAGPFVLVLMWNAAVYIILFSGMFRRADKGGQSVLLAMVFEKWIMRQSAAEPMDKSRESYLNSVTLWMRSWAGPAMASWFHAGSAFFTLGLLAAIYFRGLFTGYLAAWESTWLDASGISVVLGTLLGPASILTGIALPDSIESWAMLQRTESHPGVAAGPWIHLYAVTLAAWVLLPRTFLAFQASHHAKRMRSAPPAWSRNEPYLKRLLSLARQDGDVGIAVLPFDIKNPALIRTGAYLDKIERLVRESWGIEARACVLECAAYGTEESAWHGPWADADKCGGALLVFDIHATPEDEVHGLVLDSMSKRFSNSRGGLLVAVECALFPPSRLDVRLALWRQFAEKRNCRVVPIDQSVVRDSTMHPASCIVRHS
jgi:hypothetical protein